MYSFIVVSCPLARVQVVIYIYDISWLTVISFVLHTYMYAFTDAHLHMYTFKYIHPCVCEHL